MKRELVMVAFPQAAIKMVVLEDGISIDDAMCWPPDLVPCVTSAIERYKPSIKKIMIMGPISYIRNFKQTLKRFTSVPIELGAM